MDKSPLEKFFDKHIANEASEMEEEEEEQEEEEQEEEEFFRLLPDELLDLQAAHTGDRSETGQSLQLVSGNSTNPDHGSQTPAAATNILAVPEIKQKAIPPQIHNIVSTVRLGCVLDLNLIAHKGINVEYKPELFQSVIMRLRKPRATALIYKTGSLICMGTKSTEDSRTAARRFARILQKLGMPVRFLDFKVQSLMATCQTFPINLSQLARYPDCCYEPELFPCLFYKVRPGMSLGIFPSGKITISGAKTEAEVYQVFEKITPMLSSCQRN